MSSGILTQVPGLQNLLAQCQRRVRLHAAVRGLAETVCVLLSGLFVACLLDFLFVLPGGIRSVLLGAVLLATLATVWLRFLRPLQGCSPEELGAAIDLRFPELQESVATLISIQRSGETVSDAGSEIMQERLREQVSQRVLGIRAYDVMDVQPVLRRATVAILLLLLVSTPFLFWPDASRLLLRRFTMPFANLETATNLYFDVQPGDHVAATGSSILFSAQPLFRTGQSQTRPQAVQLELQATDGHFEQLPMFWDEASGTFTATLVQAAQSLNYRVTSDSAASGWFRLLVADPPRILAATLQETPPAWTNRPVQTVDGVVGDITVFERSEIRIQLGFSKPVQQLHLEWIDWEPLQSPVTADASFGPSDRTPAAGAPAVASSDSDAANPLPEELAAAAAGVPMAGIPEDAASNAGIAAAGHQPLVPQIVLAADRRSAVLSFPALGGGRFRFAAADEYGLTNGSEPDRRLVVTADAPPVLHVTGLTDGLAVRPDDIVPLNCHVTDDVGVGLLEVHLRRNQDAVRVLPAVPLDHGSQDVTHAFRVDLRTLDVAQGDTIEFRVRAADERQIPGPQVVWKGPWSIRIRDDADPLGRQALREADQQLIDALRAMSEELGKDATTAAQLRDQAQRDWNENTREEARSLSEKDQTQGNELQRLAEQTGEHPLMQKQATKLAELAANVRQVVPELLDQARTAERDSAVNNLHQAAQELNRSRDELNRAIDEIQQAAQLEQNLADLNRIALDAEQLADDSEKFQQQRQAGPEAGQQLDEFHQQIAQEQQRLQHKQQEVNGDLNDLLQREQQLLQAARDAQLDQAAEAARQLQDLARRQQNLAEGVNQEARDAAQDAQELANQLQQARNDTEQLGRELEQQASDVPRPALQPLDEAVRELRQGNLRQPRQNIDDVSRQLDQATKQLSLPPQAQPDENDPATTNPATTNPNNQTNPADKPAQTNPQPQRPPAEPETPRQQLAQKTDQLQQRLTQLNQQLRELAENRGAQPQAADPQAGQPQPGDQQPGQPQPGDAQAGQPRTNPSRSAAENLLEQLEQMAQAAQEQSDSLQNAEAAPAGALNSAQQAAQQSSEATRNAQAGQFQQASERIRAAAAESNSAADQLNQAPLQDREAQLRQQREDLNRLADSFRQLQQDSAAQVAAQQQSQQAVADEASDIPQMLENLAQRLNNPALGLQSQAAPSLEAAQASQQAAQNGQQAADGLNEAQLQQAGQAAQSAANQLNRAAQLTRQAAQGQRNPNNPIPSQVGEEVGNALQSLQQAAEMMNAEAQASQQTAQPGESGEAGQQGPMQPGEQGQPGQEGQPGPTQPGEQGQPGQPGQRKDSSQSEQPGQPGQPGESNRPGESGEPGESNRPGESGEPGEGQSQGNSGSARQLSQAAKSLQKAAQKALPRQFSPGELPTDSGSGTQASQSQGNPAEFDGVTPESTVGRGRRRAWGQLQDELDNDVQDAGREVLDSEYFGMIRRYRRDLARSRSQTPSGGQVPKP